MQERLEEERGMLRRIKTAVLLALVAGAVGGGPGGPERADDRLHERLGLGVRAVVGGGLRAGWVAASGPVFDRIVAEKRGDDIHSPTLPQLTVARYLASGHYPAQIDRAREHYRHGMATLCEALDSELGSLASWTEPLGGGHLWLTLDLPLDERELADEALREGVAYVPGGAMRIERSRDLSMRLSFGYLDDDEAREGVRRLARAVENVRRRAPRAVAVPV
jgi:DNA-binding transcriptional MocR family regulator